jgi:hypothetical protein
MKKAFVASTVLGICIACVSHTICAQESLLVLRGPGTAFEEATKGLKEELGSEFSIHEMIVGSVPADTILKRLARTPPSIVVLMDNRAIRLFQQYQSGQHDTAHLVPSVALMSAFVDQAIQNLRNTAAISYEVPVVTAAVDLRLAFGMKLTKIGIIHRPFLNEFIIQNAKYCTREGIALADAVVPNDPSQYKQNIEKSLKHLLSDEKVDALWVPNDNKLLESDIILSVWVPIINKFKKPVIVGVRVLVQPELKLGTFAVLPDHVALGTQAADLVRKAKKDNWTFPSKYTMPIVSVYKIVNLPQAMEFCHVHKESLNSVECILENKQQ